MPVLIKLAEDIIRIRESIPNEWQNNEAQQTYVAYLFDDIANPKLIDDLPIRREHIQLIYVCNAIIWNIDRRHYNASQITRLASHRSYERMTIRNVNTARKLAKLCEED